MKRFLFARMYRHPRLDRLRSAAGEIIEGLFRRYRAEPELLGADVPADDEARLARRIADHIAGMTDRFARAEHQRLFDVTPALR